jgi:hypothetical protein
MQSEAKRSEIMQQIVEQSEVEAIEERKGKITKLKTITS